MSVKIIYRNNLYIDNIFGNCGDMKSETLNENELIKIQNRYIPYSKFLYEMTCDGYV